jgi:hypothetical protein
MNTVYGQRFGSLSLFSHSEVRMDPLSFGTCLQHKLMGTENFAKSSGTGLKFTEERSAFNFEGNIG